MDISSPSSSAFSSVEDLGPPDQAAKRTLAQVLCCSCTVRACSIPSAVVPQIILSCELPDVPTSFLQNSSFLMQGSLGDIALLYVRMHVKEAKAIQSLSHAVSGGADVYAPGCEAEWGGCFS